MAVLEELLGQMLGGGMSSQNQSPVGGMISSLFQGLPGGMNSSGVGGLPGLLHQFESAGLGHVIQSWIGNGPNQDIDPQQLRHVLGNDRVNSMAQSSGMDSDTLLGQLSQLLPGLVDRMTPQGHLPTESGHGTVANPFGGRDEAEGGSDPWAGPGQASA